MRICLVTKAYPPDGIGGAARYVYLLAHGLVAEGHDVTVIAGLEGDQAGDAKNRSAQDRKDGKEAARPSSKGVQPTDHRSHLVKVRKIQDHRLPLSGLWRKLGRGGFAKVLERSWAVDQTISQLEAIEGAFDVVEVTNSGPEGLIYSLHSRAPLVIRLSTPLAVSNQFKDRPSTRLGFRLSCYLEALAARRADCVITNSRFNAECCGGLYRIPFGEMHLVPHGIVAPECPQAVRVTKDRIATVLYVGRLQRRKGIDLLLQAIPPVTAKVKRVSFVIAGLDTGDAPYTPQTATSRPKEWTYEDYFATFATHEARRATAFLGHVDENTLERLYAECDVLAAPSLSESFGLMYVEAMVYAKPVIAFNIGAAQEIVAPNETGILVENGSVSELADTLIRLAEDGEMRQEMGRRGYERARAKFSVQRMVEETVACYRKVVFIS